MHTLILYLPVIPSTILCINQWSADAHCVQLQVYCFFNLTAVLYNILASLSIQSRVSITCYFYAYYPYCILFIHFNYNYAHLRLKMSSFG